MLIQGLNHTSSASVKCCASLVPASFSLASAPFLVWAPIDQLLPPAKGSHAFHAYYPRFGDKEVDCVMYAPKAHLHSGAYVRVPKK